MFTTSANVNLLSQFLYWQICKETVYVTVIKKRKKNSDFYLSLTMLFVKLEN